MINITTNLVNCWKKWEQRGFEFTIVQRQKYPFLSVSSLLQVALTTANYKGGVNKGGSRPTLLSRVTQKILPLLKEL